MLSSSSSKEDSEIYDIIYKYCDYSDDGYYISSPGLLNFLREKGFDIVRKTPEPKT